MFSLLCPLEADRLVQCLPIESYLRSHHPKDPAWASQMPHFQREHPETSGVAVTKVGFEAGLKSVRVMGAESARVVAMSVMT